MADDLKPIEEDTRFDDIEFNPSLEPHSAKAWLNLLVESEDAFEQWNDRCDNIDKQYASLGRLADMVRDKEFQMFWANCEVLKPSIYAKPPVPVVVTKFKDRRPVYQAASEMLERCCVVAFDLTTINDLMLLVRDDLSMNSRGVAWCRYEGKGGDGHYQSEKVCIDFKGRRDFLHSISRNWREVTWVAGASYLTRAEARERFKPYSGEEYQRAEYKVDKEAANIGGADNRERAKFWEIWDKQRRRVVWVAEGCEDILDEDDAHLELRGFFPCPKPAYGTVQRGSLVPVPDVLQYRDQLEEINLLTGRIHALSDALEVKGFYPAGGAELSDAIQQAISIKTPGRVLVPISNWAAFGGSKEIIIWMPIDMIAQTVTALVTLRKQVTEDIYQIMGLSDIMRGATDPNETLGAQQLKTQYGSTRIRDKQQEMVRLARDLVEITSEIITQKFSPETMIMMSQTQVKSQAQLQQEVQELYQKIQGKMQELMSKAQDPQTQQMDPAKLQEMAAQVEQAIQQDSLKLSQLQEEPTLEQVMYFLRDERTRAFVLDIETDSTILQDENAEKERRTEFVAVLGQMLPQITQMIAAEPKTAAFCGELLKFSVAPFRSGRTLDGSIDELIEMMKMKGDRPQGDDPQTAQNKMALQIEQMKDKTQKEKNQQEAALKTQELQQRDAHKKAELENARQIKMAELQAKQQDASGKVQIQNQKAATDREAHQAHMIEKTQDLEMNRQKAQLLQQQHAMKQNDMANRANERQMAAAQKAAQRPPGGIV